jgi:hypothetical protein
MEVPEIAADYFCHVSDVLGASELVTAAVYSDIVKWVGPKFEDGEDQLPFIVGWIFRSVCGDAGGGAGSKNPGIMPTMELLQKAAQAYNVTMGEEMGVLWTENELQWMRQLAIKYDHAMELPELDGGSGATGGSRGSTSEMPPIFGRSGVTWSSLPSESSSRTYRTPGGANVEMPRKTYRTPSGFTISVDDGNALLDALEAEASDEWEDEESDN